MVIKELRTATGLSQKALARKVGVNQRAVGQWENGECLPRADKLPKIADALGCGINDLFAKDGEEVEG